MTKRKRRSIYRDVHEQLVGLASRKDGVTMPEMLAVLRTVDADADPHAVQNRLFDMRKWEHRDIRSAGGGIYRLTTAAKAEGDHSDFDALRAHVAQQYGVRASQVEVRIVL